MGIDWRQPYQLYREGMHAFLPDIAERLGQGPHFPGLWLADAATAVQMAVAERLTGRDGYGRRPLASESELLAAAARVRLPPDGRRVAVSRPQLEQILALPALMGEELGPLLAVAALVVGQSASTLGMVELTVLFPVVRTLEFDAIGRTGPHDHLLSFVGAGHRNDGVGLMLSTCVEHEAEAEPAAQVDLRLRQLAAIRDRLCGASGRELLMLLRGERRHVEEAEGSGTAERVWCVGEQAGWPAILDRRLPTAVALAEVSPEWLRGLEYSLDGGSRRIGALDPFFSAVERRDPSVGAWTLRMTYRRRERELAADDVVVSDACVIGPDGNRFALVMPVSDAETTLYAMPYERAERLGDDGWDVVRVGLASVHGASAARSSDDQGRALVLPHRHALSLTGADGDRAANFNALRTFSHAIEASSHWLGGGPSAPEPDTGDREERRAA